MGDLILNSLEIRNFRGFQHLQIERLGRVNLIVGKNNIGKTSLLEALQLYARRGNPLLILAQLRQRDESRATSAPYGESEELLTSLKYLFYGRSDTISDTIAIGPADSVEQTVREDQKLYISLELEGAFPSLIIKKGSDELFHFPLGPTLPVPSRIASSRTKEINCASLSLLMG
jgi:predicted ATP-dependent endonuclease of OLD family